MKPFLTGRPAAGGPALRPAGMSGDDTRDEGGPTGPGRALTAPGSGGVGGAMAESAASSGHGTFGRAGAHQHAGGGASPSVECIKQGDKVVRLVITCTCGERIEVECLYPAGA